MTLLFFFVMYGDKLVLFSILIFPLYYLLLRKLVRLCSE